MIDLRKVPRPERSGYIAILIAYVLVCSYFEHFIPDGIGVGLPNIACMLFPMIPELCPSKQPAENEARQEYRKMRFTPLVTTPGKSKKKICGCHVDILTIQDASVEHLYQRQEITCDTFDDFLQPRVWTRVPDGAIVSWDSIYDPPPRPPKLEGGAFWINYSRRSMNVWANKNKYRYHCEEWGPQRRKH